MANSFRFMYWRVCNFQILSRRLELDKVTKRTNIFSGLLRCAAIYALESQNEEGDL